MISYNISEEEVTWTISLISFTFPYLSLTYTSCTRYLVPNSLSYFHSSIVVACSTLYVLDVMDICYFTLAMFKTQVLCLLSSCLVTFGGRTYGRKLSKQLDGVLS